MSDKKLIALQESIALDNRNIELFKMAVADIPISEQKLEQSIIDRFIRLNDLYQKATTALTQQHKSLTIRRRNRIV